MIEEIDRNKINETLSNWRNTSAAIPNNYSYFTMSPTTSVWTYTSLSETDVLINKLNEIIRAVNELESKITTLINSK